MTSNEISKEEAVDKNGYCKNHCYIEYIKNETHYYTFDEKGTMENFEEIILKATVLNTKALQTIKNCAIYFTTISIISIIAGIIYFLFKLLHY